MAVHKLVFDDFLEDDYHLLAIHSTQELYRVAYLLNQSLQTRFRKTDMPQSDELQYFDFYEYNDEKNQTLWNLVANKGTQKRMQESSKLEMFFAPEETILTYLLPEYKTVDYFIKIEDAAYDIQNITSKISAIPQIITTFVIDASDLKSKNNLIFY